jgi:hypothetical protein
VVCINIVSVRFHRICITAFIRIYGMFSDIADTIFVEPDKVIRKSKYSQPVYSLVGKKAP